MDVTEVAMLFVMTSPLKNGVLKAMFVSPPATSLTYELRNIASDLASAVARSTLNLLFKGNLSAPLRLIL